MKAPPYRPLLRAICKSHHWPEPEFEVRVAPPRRWRFDIAWPAVKLAVEVNGGVFVQGRHSRGADQIKDYEKLNAAQLAGWRVLQITPGQITDGELVRLLTLALGRGVPRSAWETLVNKGA